MTNVTPELLRTLLRYEPETGKLFWLKRDVSLFKEGKHTASRICNVWNAKYSGKEALAYIGNDRYKRGKIFDRSYLAHRVIWAMETGSWPEDQLDHKDHIRTNNPLCNLREATHKENSQNQSLRNTNTSGINGVFFNKNLSKWSASICLDGKNLHLGLFDNIADASSARDVANIKYGFHKNHGKAVS